MSIISKSADKYKIYHYPAVAREMLGNRWGVLLEASIIMNGYGLIVALNIIVGSLIPNILSSFNIHGGDLERALAMIILNAAVVTPLGIMRNLGALRWKALFNVTCLTFIMFVVIAEFPFFAKHNNFDEIKYAAVDINIFNAFSIALFAYLCQQNITGLQGELLNSTIKRISKVSKRAVGIMCTLFCTLSLFGYLSCLNNTPSLIILRNAPSNISNDGAMVACRIMILVIMSVAIPLNLNPCRNSIQKLIFNIQGRASPLMHYGLSLGIIITTLTLAIFFPNIKIAFHFLGGFCGGVMALIIPGLMQVKLTELPLGHWKNVTIIFITWGLAIFGFTSLIIDIYEQISN